MATRKQRSKKKAVESNDTVTFKKSELLNKLKTFLEDEGACDGDWLNKVRVNFLGEKAKSISVTLSVPAAYSFDMTTDDVLTKEKITEYLRSMADTEIDYSCFEYDLSELEVTDFDAEDFNE